MTDDVRAALRSLADGEHRRRRPTDALDTIAEGRAALDDVRAAAAFVEDDGLERLRRAVRRADRTGHSAAAERGRDALATLDRCRRAAADHFRSGRGTVLGDGAQGPLR